jgi:hypothetical protein
MEVNARTGLHFIDKFNLDGIRVQPLRYRIF